MKLVPALLFVVACGDSGALPDAGAIDGNGAFMTAAHTPLPLAIPHNGAILDHVQLVTITYSDYADTANVEAFGDAIVASDWYAAVGADYGLGAGTHAAKVHLGPAPTTTLTDVDITNEIQSLVMNQMVPTPPATGNEYVYMIYIPSTVPLDPDSLSGFYGYHDQATVAGVAFPYAVILDDGTGTATTTTTASHELVESATDPLFVDNPNGDGWYTDPPFPDPWQMIEGEVADLCNDEPTSIASGFTVQRIWSNTEAQAGRNPCIPTDGDPWMSVSASPATMPTIPAGSTAMFTLTGWSTAQIPAWSIDTTAADYSDLDDDQLDAQLSASMIDNGTSVTLTLHAPANATHGSHGGVYILSSQYERPWAVGFTVQ